MFRKSHKSISVSFNLRPPGSKYFCPPAMARILRPRHCSECTWSAWSSAPLHYCMSDFWKMHFRQQIIIWFWIWEVFNVDEVNSNIFICSRIFLIQNRNNLRKCTRTCGTFSEIPDRQIDYFATLAVEYRKFSTNHLFTNSRCLTWDYDCSTRTLET